MEVVWRWLTDAAQWQGPDSVPARVVEHLGYSAAALALAALVAVQGLTSGHDLVIDGRLAGLAAAAVALALRAPFIVVLLVAGATGALVHVVTG